MRNLKIEDKLQKIMKKLAKKEPQKYLILKKKIVEIISSQNINHYKNLRKPLQHLKRVHINSHFVLTFYYDEEKDLIKFYNFDHHDRIYI